MKLPFIWILFMTVFELIWIRLRKGKEDECSIGISMGIIVGMWLTATVSYLYKFIEINTFNPKFW